MKTKRLLLFIAIMLTPILGRQVLGSETPIQVVRMAKLEIDAAQLDNYKAALKEEIETSVRLEPGVVSLNAVAEKDHPTHVTILEIYASAGAYQSHLESPHFKKYKTATRDMVKSLELVETVPVALASKAK